MAFLTTKNLPEGVVVLVLDWAGKLVGDVDLERVSTYLADKDAFVWCDIYSTEGGQTGPYGRLLREILRFDELTIGDCFTKNHLPKVDIYDDYLFAAFSFHFLEERHRVETVELDMYIGENYVVCVHPLGPLGSSTG